LLFYILVIHTTAKKTKQLNNQSCRIRYASY